MPNILTIFNIDNIQLLLTGNALSLPNMIVLNKILRFRRTGVYLVLTVGLSMGAGMLFGMLMS